MKRRLSHVWVYVYARTAARGWARCHCGEAVRRLEALAVWSGVDCITYLTKAEIRPSFNVVHTAENHYSSRHGSSIYLQTGGGRLTRSTFLRTT